RAILRHDRRSQIRTALRGNSRAPGRVEVRAEPAVYTRKIMRFSCARRSGVMLRWIIAALLIAAVALPASAQSQAANGAIEGTIVDTSGGVLPGVTVTMTNTETGAERSVVTNENGLYRSQLLPLGTYRVVAELPGFKKYEE